MDELAIFGYYPAMSIGDNIRKWRKNRSLTQDQLAEKIDVQGSNISRWEKGHALPNPTNLEVIAKALEVPVSELIGDNDPEISLFLGLPESLKHRLQAAVEDIEHHANLEQWLVVFEKASPRRRRAILEALGEDDEEAGG